MTYPTVPPRYIECGGYADLTIVDDDGQIKKVRFKARPPGRQDAEGKDPEPTGTPASPGKQPVHPYGTASLRVAGMSDDLNLFGAPLDADVSSCRASPVGEPASGPTCRCGGSPSPTG